MKDQPSFYSILPANVRYSDKLSSDEKILFSEINSLCNKEGVCYAQNKYFAELYNVESKTISKWINNLVAAGFLASKIDKEKGNVRVLAILFSGDTYPLAKGYLSPHQGIPIPSSGDSLYICINNKYNNKYNKRDFPALTYLFENHKMKFEVLFMKTESQIKDMKSMLEDFEAKVMKEDLSFSYNVLAGRFKQLSQNWLRNQDKFQTKDASELKENAVNKNLRNAI